MFLSRFQVESGSIAARDGRIREGDQILQINNLQVRSRDDAIALFARCHGDVTITVSRQVFQVSAASTLHHLASHSARFARRSRSLHAASRQSDVTSVALTHLAFIPLR